MNKAVKIIILLLNLTISICGCSGAENSPAPHTAEALPDTVASMPPAYESTATELSRVNSSTEPETILSEEQSALNYLLKKYTAYVSEKFIPNEEVGIYFKASEAKKCKLELQNIYGDETPEMILYLQFQVNDETYTYACFFALDTNESPFCMGCTFANNIDGFYTDQSNTYFVCSNAEYNSLEGDSMAVLVKMEKTIPNVEAWDIMEYYNCSAEDFMTSTNTGYFIWNNVDFDNPKESAAEFYYDDRKQYEIYCVSQKILDITGIDVNTQHKMVSMPLTLRYCINRQEYVKIKEKLMSILNKVESVPTFSSNWVEIQDIRNLIAVKTVSRLKKATR